MRLKAALVWTFIFALLLLSWELAARSGRSIEFFAGSPSSIFSALLVLIQEGLHRHFLVTGLEAASGLLIGTLGGASLGLMMWYYRKTSELPIFAISAVGSVPILAFAPLMIVWFGVGIPMKVALAAITTFFVSFAQAMQGAKAVSGEHIEFLQAMRATEAQIFKKVIIPGSLSWVLASMRLNASFCLLGAFVGEFIAAEQGLGYLILKASSLYNMPRALAAGIGIAVLALGFDFLARKLESERDRIAQMLSVPREIWRPARSARLGKLIKRLGFP